MSINALQPVVKHSRRSTVEKVCKIKFTFQNQKSNCTFTLSLSKTAFYLQQMIKQNRYRIEIVTDRSSKKN
jgi:hypothetical protein